MSASDIRPLAKQLIKLGTLPEIEREIYRAAIEEFGKTEAVACQLGVTAQTVRNKKRRYKIEPDTRQSKIF